MRELDRPIWGHGQALTAGGHERDAIHRDLADHAPTAQRALQALPHQLSGAQPACDGMQRRLPEMRRPGERVHAARGADQHVRRYQARQGAVEPLSRFPENQRQIRLAIHVHAETRVHIPQAVHRQLPTHEHKYT